MKSLNILIKTVCMLLTVCIFVFFNSNAWATPIKYIAATAGDPGAPVTIGETKLVPILIHIHPQWESASVRLEIDTRYFDLPAGVSASSVQFEEVKIDTELRGPLTVYIPVKVTGEGLFSTRGIIDFQVPEGSKDLNGNIIVGPRQYTLSGPGIFSFDGEVFFGGDTEDATFKMVDRNLQKENSVLSKLLQKKQLIQKWVLEKSALSEMEEKELKETRSKEFKRLRTMYFDRYPIKSELKPKALPQPLNQGDSVTLEVNWSTDSNFYRWIMPRLS